MELKKNYKYWDVAPTGYENMSAEEFKQIQLIGQILPSLNLNEGNVVNVGVSAEYPSIGNTVSRQARRIYVDNLPLGVTEEGMMEFFNEQIKLKEFTPHKLFVGGLPQYLGEDQVKELLQTFGPLRGFNLVKDSTTGLSKGYAFCEYADHAVTDKACMGLTGMQLGEKRIVVQRACLLSQPIMMDPAKAANVEETEVLCLHNMVMIDDLNDDEEYEEIMEDVKEECSKFGTVLSVQIPRPTGSQDANVSGVGKIFVEFISKSDSVKAMKALSGRTFSGKVAATSFYDLEKYRNGFF